MLFDHGLQGPFGLGMGVVDVAPQPQREILAQLQRPSMPGIRLLELVDPAVHLLAAVPKWRP